MDEQQILMKMFPQLISNYNFTAYDGFINAEGVDFQVSLQVPNYPSLFNLSLQSSWMASHLLEGHDLLLNEWLKNGTLCSFLENLQKLLVLETKKKASLCSHSEECLTPESFQTLISDLTEVEFSNVIYLSSSLCEIQLKAVDEADREHIIDVKLGKSYPLEPVLIQAMLPDSAVEIISKNTRLNDIYRSFVQQIVTLQNVWDTLDVIDSHCCVLDPEHPNRKDMGRRIIIERNVSVYLNMNVEDAAAIPGITVLGPEKTVQHYQSTLSRNIKMWDLSNSVVDNLRQVLGLESLPAKLNSEEDPSLVQQGECRICFTIRLDGELPSEICEDSHCASAFHTACLFQWLQTVVGNYQSFNQMHGVCPNCSTAISCPIPKHT